MRIRLRFPSGSAILTISDADTVAHLLSAIADKTSMHHFDIKYGYPPKLLRLDTFPKTSRLNELGIKLDGEQFIITEVATVAERKPSNDGARRPPRTSTPFSFAGTRSKPSQASEPQSGPSVPLSLSRKQNPSVESDPPEIPCPSHAATLVLRIMPDDNSCLFRAFGTAVLPTTDSMNELRSLVASTIQEDPEKYNEGILGKKPDDYCRWIQRESSWGGGIEMSIFSKHFDTEICSVDVQTGRVDKFNPGASTRCILVYSGIHFDTIALSPSDPPFNHAYAPPEVDVKVFDSSDHVVLEKALALCNVLKERHYFTDTASFEIKCNTCGKKLKGERAAIQHAEDTGHNDFGEA